MKAKKLPFIDKVFLWINYCLCAALLISYLAPITDPQKFWPVAFFGLAYPLLLLANVLMIVYWLVRKSTWVLLPVIGIGIGWNILLNNIGFTLPAHASIAPESNNVRVMTYNVHSFKKYGANKDISTKHEILAIIRDAHPDIIGFQEYYTRNRGQYDMTDSIKRITGASNCYFEQLESNKGESLGMAIFSKFPILAKGIIRLSAIPQSGNQCLYIDVQKGGHPFRFYSLHLQSIKFGPQDYKYVDTVSKSGKADLASTMRLGGKLKRAFLKRSEQVAIVKAHAKQCPYPYIISGDFNDTPSSYAVNQMANGLKNAFREKGFGLGRTYNGNFPNYQIDYVMTDKKFDIENYHITEKKLSDHYPVYVDVVLR